MTDTRQPTSNFGWQHFLVVGFGLLVFVLLVFADKTNLNEDDPDAIAGRGEGDTEAVIPESNEAVSGSLLEMLPPSEPSEDVAILLTALEGEKNTSSRSELLRDIVEGFQREGRLDVAAVYAGMLAEEEPTGKNQLVAGALFRNANLLPTMMADTTAFRKFSDAAIQNLEAATKSDPDNEDAQIELGLAYVEARSAGLSMQGILKIREVAEANPQNTEALFHLGGFSLETGQFDKAEGRFRQILEVEADNVRAKYYLGVALLEQGQSAEFKKWMTEVAEQKEEPELAAAAQSALNNN